ncbi:MAG: Late Golgi vesicles protein [Heterodermia speciosa]|uniref:Late Golgi vesicles protein n=1 Tax=Heterodermia speciosa TaxID=116794 RepID=A0A8H3F0R0_9LECA|nr:MAG: Late Golgi vesicles protein [Heterodermia speciosa]
MDLSNIFRLVNLAVGGLMVVGGIMQFFPIGFQSTIIGCYVILFGAATALLEFQTPPVLSKWAPFLFSFLGRGIFYIFVGSILLHNPVIRIIVGSIIGIVGLGYAVLEYIPSIEPPENMRDANAESWGAEQI